VLQKSAKNTGALQCFRYPPLGRKNKVRVQSWKLRSLFLGVSEGTIRKRKNNRQNKYLPYRRTLVFLFCSATEERVHFPHRGNPRYVPLRQDTALARTGGSGAFYYREQNIFSVIDWAFANPVSNVPAA
jgi:hypothetical protein